MNKGRETKLRVQRAAKHQMANGSSKEEESALVHLASVRATQPPSVATQPRRESKTRPGTQWCACAFACAHMDTNTKLQDHARCAKQKQQSDKEHVKHDINMPMHSTGNAQ